MEPLAYFIMRVATYSQLLPTLVALGRGSQLSKTQRLLGLLVGVSAAVDIYASLLANSGRPNLFLLHPFTVVEFSLFVLIYAENAVVPKRLRLPIIFGFIAIAIISSYGWEPLTVFNTTARTLEGLTLLFFAVRYYYLQVSKKRLDLPASINASLGGQPMFWINAGVLLYFAPALAVILYGNFFLEAGSYFGVLIYSTLSMLGILKSILFAIALWIQLPTPKARFS
ncbi:MAG: hypothetical protein AAF433_04340 [Bacteroidota bacterium]